MASIFTYQDEPPRIHSPWSTPGTSTPQPLHTPGKGAATSEHVPSGLLRLEPEHHDGPTEYKLHLLLRPRRKFLSTSTSGDIYGSQHYIALSQPTARHHEMSNDSGHDLKLSQPSAVARQTRLQQLTTQLLWRLQQSSPFHSSSNADLVLPVLPEATPRLGVPERPAKLLPGLEESQGALYEIGVADDGTLLGLVEDELQESLVNLKAMAASLGCTTSVLRRVCVGRCEWEEVNGDAHTTQTRNDTLWVAEVLVYPDARGSTDTDVPKAELDSTRESPKLAEELDVANHATTEQMRVTLVGATAAGKSSLLGTLSTSMLDNGRGRSRLSLLKHRHEIASGITSSVAHELVGYTFNPDSKHPIINYASGNVSAWTDVHNLANRLVLLSDSPGLPRFAKSALRSLLSWTPSWTILCIASDEGTDNLRAGGGSTGWGRADGGSGEAVDLSLSYLHLCLQLNLPLMVVITKMDLANKTGLRLVLGKILSALKAVGRKPIMLSNTPAPPTTSEHGNTVLKLQNVSRHDQLEIDQLHALLQDDSGQGSVPILMSSAVTGLGISKLHALLQTLPIFVEPVTHRFLSSATSLLFQIDEVFSIPPSRVYTFDAATQIAREGIVLCGHVARGSLAVGDVMLLGPFLVEMEAPVQTALPAPRASSYGAQPPNTVALAYGRARSYQGESPRAPTPRPHASSVFVSVRVVSLRTLRLPVMEMQKGETGTIGIEPVEHENEGLSLRKARKGMVLTNPNQSIRGYHSFTAAFPAADFAGASAPVLILGGHAIAYVNSVRAAVKVTAVALDDGDTEATRGVFDADDSASEEADVFHFDGDDELGHHDENGSDEASTREKEITLTFRFVSTMEWMEVDDQILVVPTVIAAGPVAGPTPLVNSSGLTGFVGRVRELFS